MKVSLSSGVGAVGFMLGLSGLIDAGAAVAPALRIEPSGHFFVVRFDGGLQAADSPSGPFIPVEEPCGVAAGMTPGCWGKRDPGGSTHCARSKPIPRGARW